MEPNIHTVFTKKYTVSSRLNYYLSSSLLVAVDYLAIAFAALCACLLRDEILLLFNDHIPVLTLRDIYIYGIVPSIFLFFIAYADLYTRRIPFWQCAESLFKICLYVNLLVVIFTYFIGKAENISRLYMGLFFMFSFLFLCVFRYVSKKALMKMGLWQIPVIIVGAGKTAEILEKAFQDNATLGYRIVGLIEDNYNERPLLKKYPHLGTFEDIERIMAFSGVENVILATPGLPRKELIHLFYRIQPYVRNLTIVPDVFGIPFGNIKVETLLDDKTLLIKTKNNLDSYLNKGIKRIFDLGMGCMIFLVIIPFLAIVSLMIKLDSKGPILHVAKRIGKDGRLFSCYKFRTMYMEADAVLEKFLKENPSYKEEWERFAKLRTVDPRITKVGKLLRRLSLDELPQIVNVLLGSMSLVGPRPYLPREREKIGDYINIICRTVPGITGLWQVSGRNEIEFSGRLQLDSWYVRNWSFWHDIVILIKTVKVVLGRDGAY